MVEEDEEIFPYIEFGLTLDTEDDEGAINPEAEKSVDGRVIWKDDLGVVEGDAVGEVGWDLPAEFTASLERFGCSKFASCRFGLLCCGLCEPLLLLCESVEARSMVTLARPC